LVEDVQRGTACPPSTWWYGGSVNRVENTHVPIADMTSTVAANRSPAHAVSGITIVTAGRQPVDTQPTEVRPTSNRSTGVSAPTATMVPSSRSIIPRPQPGPPTPPDPARPGAGATAAEAGVAKPTVRAGWTRSSPRSSSPPC